MSDEFRECAACAAKPGSPTLCPSCLHNRAVIRCLTLPAVNDCGVVKVGDIYRAKQALERNDEPDEGADNEAFLKAYNEGFMEMARKTRLPSPVKCDHVLDDAAANNIARAFR